MLAKIIRLTRYKVVVLSLKPKKGFPPTPDDGVFIHEHDHFFGRSYRQHKVGKYFDIWFTHPREDDPDNFVTFGRITQIIPEGWPGDCAIYHTKLGKFLVQKLKNGTQKDQKEKDKNRNYKKRYVRNKINTV